MIGFSLGQQRPLCAAGSRWARLLGGDCKFHWKTHPAVQDTPNPGTVQLGLSLGHALPRALHGRVVELAGVSCTVGTKTSSPRLSGGEEWGVSCP